MLNCPKCGTPYERGTKFCSSCGLNLENEFILNPVCPQCGRQFAEGTKFCDVDGARLVSADKLVPRCIKCGKEYPAGVKFCPDDGGAIVAEAYRPKPEFQGPFAGMNTGVKYPKAPLGDRFLAFLIDMLVGLVLSIPAIIFLVIGIISVSRDYSYDESFDGTGSGIVMIVLGALLFVLPMIYGFIKDGLNEGQSYGKKAMGLMVVDVENNLPCTKGKSSIRYLISALICAVPYLNLITCWIEPVMVLVTEDGRKAADLVAKTQVILKMHYRK